jgi:hypothetical protein
MQALDLHQLSLTHMRMSRDDFMDQVSTKLTKLQTMNEELGSAREILESRGRTTRNLQDEIDSIGCKNKILTNKLVRYSLVDAELESLRRDVALVQGNLPRYQEQIADERDKQTRLMAEIAMIGPAQNNEVIRRKLKKNQMKIAELEAVIRKSVSTAAAAPTRTVSEPVGPRRRAPSLIIHRTQDSAADELRLLKNVMESSIRENAEVKSELASIALDLAAMEQENLTLKALLRDLLPDRKS